MLLVTHLVHSFGLLGWRHEWHCMISFCWNWCDDFVHLFNLGVIFVLQKKCRHYEGITFCPDQYQALFCFLFFIVWFNTEYVWWIRGDSYVLDYCAEPVNLDVRDKSDQFTYLRNELRRVITCGKYASHFIVQWVVLKENLLRRVMKVIIE